MTEKMHEPLNTPVGVSKNKLWEYYKEYRDLIASSDSPANTKALEEKQKVANALAIADGLDVDAMEGALSSVVTTLRDSKKKLEGLNGAIEEKQKQLKDVHGFEATANSTVALMKAKEQAIKEAEEQAKQRLDEAHTIAADIINRAKEKQEEIDRAVREQKTAAAKEQQRAREEWEYSFAREKQAKTDEVTDALNEKIKKIKDREEEVSERETEHEELLASIRKLGETIESNEEEAEARIAEAVEAAKAQEKRSYGFEVSILKKDHEGKMNTANSEKVALERALELAERRIATLEAQIGDANERVTTIATAAMRAGADAATITEVAKTVAGASGNRK